LHSEGPLSIELRNICFRYPAKDSAVLTNVSFAAHPGEIVAITGANGSGKTTLMDIILGLRAPSSGSVFIGGAPLEVWETTALRKAVSAVPQEMVLFDGSLADNIRYGSLEASDQEVFLAARDAGLSDAVARLPQGFASRVGEQGAALSGGERRRVALARALLAQPRVLVLDEPDAMLDFEMSSSLMRVLRKNAAGRVTLIVTHNPRIAQDADRTMILAGGRLESHAARNTREGDGYLTVTSAGCNMRALDARDAL
jgi:ABC-type multidrug transport system fused ATPase/permease subunit